MPELIVTELDLKRNRFRRSSKGQELISLSQARAASFLFDLESGDLNSDVAQKLTPHEIYMGCTKASSLTFNHKGVEFVLHPYYSDLSDEAALNLMTDLQVYFEDLLVDSQLRA